MKIKYLISLSFFCFLVFNLSLAQNVTDPSHGNFYEIKKQWLKEREPEKKQESFLEKIFSKKENEEPEKEDGENQFRRWESFVEPRVYPSGSFPKPTVLWDELKKYEQQAASYKTESIAQATWQPVQRFFDSNNNYAGLISCIAFHPAHYQSIIPAGSYTIFVGSPSGGLWRTTNSGASWTPLTDRIPGIGVSSVVINPLDPRIMYIATGDKDRGDWYGNLYSYGVLKTTNGGITWNSTGLNFDRSGNGNRAVINKLLIHPNNPNILFACVKNETGGMGTGGNGAGLYKSSDAGVTWKQVVSAVCYDVEFKPGSNSGTVYACGYGGSFYKSTNAGDSATWTNITPGSPVLNPVKAGARTLIAVTPSDTNVVYMAYEKSGALFGLYKSTDAGQTWDSIPSSKTGLDGGNSGGYCFALAVSPQKTCCTHTDIIAVGFKKVFTSDDGGYTWRSASSGSGHEDQRSLEFLPKNITNIFDLFIANDGGIFKWSNFYQFPTNPVTPIHNGLEVLQFFRLGNSAADPNVICAGAQDNHVWKYTATNTVLTLIGDGMECIVDHTNPDVIYYSGPCGYINKYNHDSYDRNVSQPDGNNTAFITPFAMHPINSQILYFARNHGVYKTVNGGQNISLISPQNLVSNCNPCDAVLRTIAVAPSDPDNVIYTTSWTNVLKTTNGGANWTDITNGLPALGGIDVTAISYIAVHPNDPQTVWVTMMGYTGGKKVFKTIDGGINWTNISGSLPNLPVNCIVYENGSPDALYLGTDMGVFYRDNASADWIPYMNGLPNTAVMELEIQYGAKKLRAATFGRGLWQNDLMQHPNRNIILDPNLPVYSKPTAGLTCSPNPFSDVTTIGYKLDKKSLVSLSVLDYTGNAMQTLLDGVYQDAGFMSYEFNASSLAGGTYFVKLQVDGTVYTQKIVLIK